jgi:hypothetical protein
MRLSNILAAGIAAALIAGPALAQAQAFPAQSFDQMIASDLAIIQQQHRTVRAGDIFFNPGLGNNARSRATFTGQWRPLDGRKQAFIVAFASTSEGNSSYAGLYQREYLFRAGGKDFWLPVQTQVAGYFATELASGTPVTLYLRNAGGYRSAKDWDWVFLVEEFAGPKGAAKPEATPAPGAPGKPKAPVIPPGPKIQT